MTSDSLIPLMKGFYLRKAKKPAPKWKYLIGHYLNFNIHAIDFNETGDLDSYYSGAW